MLETPVKDHFSMPWWSESFESSPRRQSSVPRINCNLSRLKVESDDSESSEIDIASKKLTWISREDYNSPRRNFADRPSIQNGSVYGRSARFGAAVESPGRGFQIPPESPARRGESVRRLRTPTMDFDMTKSPSSASPTRRLRSVGSPKHGSATPKSEHTLVREASAIRRVLAARDQRNSSKSTVQAATKESPGMISTGDSPESDPMVVSYLAEETDRIIKGRIQKLKLQSQSNANANVADQQLQAEDHERSSAREVRNANGGKHPKHSSHSSILQVDITTAERVGKSNVQRDHRAGELDHESYVHVRRPGSTSSPGSPLPRVQYNAPASNGDGGPTRTISATMENYLENRRKGSNIGPQIVVSGRPGSPVSTAASNSNLAVLREENQVDNPSTSRRNGGSWRHDSVTESRAALSPLNGNEDVTHSTTTLSQRKEEYSTGGLGEEAIHDGRNDSKESVQMEGENGFPSRLQYWAEFLGEDEMDSTEGLRYLTQESEERISRSGRKELGTKIAPVRFHSNGGSIQSPQARTQIDGHIRHPAARGHSQRYEEVGRSLLPDKKLGSGSSGDKHNSSRRSQSCRRDPIINSLLDFSLEDEALSARRLASLSTGLDDSSNTKSPRRFSVDKNLSSTDVSPEEPPSVEVLIKTESDVKESSERKHARRFSVSVIDSAGNSSPNGGGNSASIPAPRRKPKSSFSAPLQRPVPNPELINKSNHPRTRMSFQTKTAALDSQLSENQKDGAQVEQPKRSHRSSQSLDQDTLKKLFVKTKKDNRRGPSVTPSPSVPQTGKMNSPKTTAKPQPASPGTSFQRWLANQFKIGSKSKPSSTGNDRQLPEEEKPRKKSPWRRKPAELFQGLTRRIGSSTPRCTSLPLFEANGLSRSPRVNSFEVDSSSQSESFTISSVPWHLRVMYAEPGIASPHGNAYVLPSVATLSPAYTNGSPSLPTNRRLS